MTDEKLIEAIAAALKKPLESDNDIYWAAEYGRPTPQTSLDALATAALKAYRDMTGDDGK